jgi:hypothetical protein
MQVGAATYMKSTVFTFQCVNQKPDLNWLCLTMILLNILFWQRRLFVGWKPKLFDRATSLSEISFLENLNLRCCFSDVRDAAVARLLFLCFFGTVYPYYHWGIAKLQRFGVISIFSILIYYFLYRKKRCTPTITRWFFSSNI